MTEYPRRIDPGSAADDVKQVVALHRLFGDREARALGVIAFDGILLINGRGCSTATQAAAQSLIAATIFARAGMRLRLRGCPAAFTDYCIDAARAGGVLDRLEVVVPRGYSVSSWNKVDTKPRDCPRTFEGLKCLHGGEVDEFGRPFEDHMHLAFRANGERVEWLSHTQWPRWRSPRYTHVGVMLDTLAVLVLVVLGAAYLLAAFYGDRTWAVWQRVMFGVTTTLLWLVVARIMFLVNYVDQQAAPDKFGGD